jgi:hypothetical protein
MVKAGALVAAVASLTLGACKGDPTKCEAAIRNYTSLVFWDGADKDVAKAPEADRAALRKQKLAEYTTTLERGLDTLTSQCVSAGNDKQVQCMIDAKTADDARACTD